MERREREEMVMYYSVIPAPGFLIEFSSSIPSRTVKVWYFRAFQCNSFILWMQQWKQETWSGFSQWPSYVRREVACLWVQWSLRYVMNVYVKCFISNWHSTLGKSQVQKSKSIIHCEKASICLRVLREDAWLKGTLYPFSYFCDIQGAGLQACKNRNRSTIIWSTVYVPPFSHLFALGFAVPFARGENNVLFKVRSFCNNAWAGVLAGKQRNVTLRSVGVLYLRRHREPRQWEIRELWLNKILLLQFQGKCFSLFFLKVLTIHPL